MDLTFDTTERCARELDARDELARFRERFSTPPGMIYVDGNSLGLLCRDAEEALAHALEDWRTQAIGGWLDGAPPWFQLAEELGALAAPLVGAAPEEVVATGATTVNLHALIATLYEPRGARRKILAAELEFPSDLYALRSQIALRGGNPEEDLILARSADGYTLEEEAIVALMGEEVALAHLSSVLYRSGQLLDLPRLASAAHERGIPIGLDLSHSAGAVPHRLSEWGIDYAVWCGYKYLNGGPGACAFLYLARRHFDRAPGLAGWFGCAKEHQFEMRPEFDHKRGAGGWQVSTPAVLAAAPLLGSLRVLREAGLEPLRAKSLLLTAYFDFLVDELLSAEPYGFRLATPRAPERRGGHVALAHAAEAWRITQALRARGVVPDFRPPDTIRIAPAPLYNGFHELWRIARHLRAIIDDREYEAFDPRPSTVS